MKLIEIPFDASLIGQEGIVVKYRNGETPDFVKVYSRHPVSLTNNGELKAHTVKGSHLLNDNYDLIMYREQKVMTVEQIIKETLGDAKGEYARGWKNGMEHLAAAIKEGIVEI
jgi:hypothetical protein